VRAAPKKKRCREQHELGGKKPVFSTNKRERNLGERGEAKERTLKGEVQNVKKDQKMKPATSDSGQTSQNDANWSSIQGNKTQGQENEIAANILWRVEISKSRAGWAGGDRCRGQPRLEKKPSAKRRGGRKTSAKKITTSPNSLNSQKSLKSFKCIWGRKQRFKAAKRVARTHRPGERNKRKKKREGRKPGKCKHPESRVQNEKNKDIQAGGGRQRTRGGVGDKESQQTQDARIEGYNREVTFKT